MNYGKAVEEVWEWRAKIAEKTKDMTMEEQRKYLSDKGRALCAKRGLTLRTRETVKA